MVKERNYGVELLRIVLMFFIILGHLFTHSGVRFELPFLSIKWIYTWGAQSITVCAVNCFIIITGFYSTSSTLSISKILKLWAQVFVVSLSIYIILLLSGVIHFNIIEFIHSLFPLLSQQYWFFSNYILLILLSPFINVLINNLNRFCLITLSSIIIVVFYILPIFSIIFPSYDLTDGMGIIAFLTLYILGAVIQKLDIKLTKFKCVLGVALNCIIVLLSKIVLSIIVSKLNLNVGTSLLYHNNTIFQLGNAILLFLLFNQVNLKNKAISVIKFFSSNVFIVYLLHEHSLIRDVIWNNSLLQYLLNLSTFAYIVMTILIALLIFIIATFISKIIGFLISLIFNSKINCKLKGIDATISNKFLNNID